MAFNYTNYYVKTAVTVKVLTEPVSFEEAEEGKADPLKVLTEPVSQEEAEEGKSDSLNVDLNNEIFNFSEEEKVSLEETPNPPKIQDTVAGKICKGQYFLGVRLNSLIYGDKGFRNTLGLYQKTDLTLNEKKTSIKVFRNYGDAAALDVVSSVYATFSAKKVDDVYPVWGLKHRTYIVFDAQKNLDELAQFLYSKEFKFGEKGSSYVIEPDSIKIRRSRKTGISL